LLFITGFHSNHGEISPRPKLRDPPGLSNLTGPGPGLKKKSDYGLSDEVRFWVPGLSRRFGLSGLFDISFPFQTSRLCQDTIIRIPTVVCDSAVTCDRPESVMQSWTLDRFGSVMQSCTMHTHNQTHIEV
jgi:hypothetical protein